MHLRKALQGLAASGNPFRVSLSATASAVPFGCRKCFPLDGGKREEMARETLTGFKKRPADFSVGAHFVWASQGWSCLMRVDAHDGEKAVGG